MSELPEWLGRGPALLAHRGGAALGGDAALRRMADIGLDIICTDDPRLWSRAESTNPAES
jgi:hypothetical protein